jgi:hypothetical protein
MNPEGRMTEWEDVTKEDLPNAEMMAAHAAPIPNTPDPIAESLLAEAGKGYRQCPGLQQLQLSSPEDHDPGQQRV